MKVSRIHTLEGAVIAVCLGLAMAACNTTKATVDSIAKFTSSTSPDSMFSQDGIVQEHQKLHLYTAIVSEQLRQDIAKGSGEYLASLAVLLDVPQDRREEWQRLAQSRYSALFPDTVPPGEGTVTRLNRELAP